MVTLTQAFQKISPFESERTSFNKKFGYIILFITAIETTEGPIISQIVHSKYFLREPHDTQHNDIQHEDTPHNNIQHNDTQRNISIIATLSIK
jgi:hypothetical protein